MDEKVSMAGKTCSKVTKNPFFNFLRCYRAQPMNQHRSAVETAVQGAKIWKKLSANQREPFEKMAEPLLKPGVQRKPRSAPRRRQRRSRSTSRSRARRTTRTRAVGSRSATRRGRSAARRARSAAARRSRSAAGRTTRTAAKARSARRRSKGRSRSATRGRAAAATTRKRVTSKSGRAARKTTTAAAKSKTRARSTAAARKRTAKARSRSRARSATPRRAAKRTRKTKSASRKAASSTRRRRGQIVTLDAYSSPAGCDVCPRPAVTAYAKAPTAKTAPESAAAATSACPLVCMPAKTGSVLLTTSVDEASDHSGPTLLPHESCDSKMVAEDPISPPRFRMSTDKLIVGRDMDMNQSSSHKRGCSESKKHDRTLSVGSEEETAPTSQDATKRRRH